MEKEKQVCNLKLARKLKELGVEQESLFYWIEESRLPEKWKENNLQAEYEWKVFYKNEVKPTSKDGYVEIAYQDKIFAFTCAELGEMLPRLYLIMKVAEGNSPDWCCLHKHLADGGADWDNEEIMRADTQANAMAKMLIYLIKNKLLCEQ